MPINCIAIDDDPNSIENLNSYLVKIPDLQLVKSFTDPVQALTDISSAETVDIIFMDIEMPALSGIELAKLLRKKTKHLIFTTAHPRYALDAFNVAADGYLLKPYSLIHFSEAINNLYPNENPIGEELLEESFSVQLRENTSEAVEIVFNELVMFEQINEMVYFRTINGNYMSFKLNFSKILELLRKHPTFIQVNSSAIISKLHIKSFLGDQIVLKGGLSTSLASKYKESFVLFVKQNLMQQN
ncbi:response regulator transcription factor [Pedobacter aquatilis]|uniref:LytR/AlgR family response regulator transcription factor n=1 Tax=Pedobacter aquatilis TaxID=351343 RepID=UPI0025B390A1|nr:response regulator transcription factor [Pedobacter aquatilis]MDN3585806.1 response regulator transcription factor [Pedobacter aquatilis]